MRKKRKPSTSSLFSEARFNTYVAILIGLPLVAATLYLFVFPFVGILIFTYIGLAMHIANQKLGAHYFDTLIKLPKQHQVKAVEYDDFYRKFCLGVLSLIGMHCALSLLVPFSPAMLLACIFCTLLISYKVKDAFFSKEKIINSCHEESNLPPEYFHGRDVELHWRAYFKSLKESDTYLAFNPKGVWFQMGRESARRLQQNPDRPKERSTHAIKIRT